MAMKSWKKVIDKKDYEVWTKEGKYGEKQMSIYYDMYKKNYAVTMSSDMTGTWWTKDFKNKTQAVKYGRKMRKQI